MNKPDKQHINYFKDSLNQPNHFTITYELVPGRGSGGKRLERILTFAELAKKDSRIQALSITDNPGGHPALAPSALGLEIKAIGIEPLLHFSLKDKNRNMAESQLFECQRNGMKSILVLGGDYPRQGYFGQALPVFDIDSVQLLALIAKLQHTTLLGENFPGGKQQLPPMDFFAGCVVSPFKQTEAEQVYQYIKLQKKVAAGAKYIITQLGFDMIKFQEMLSFCKKAEYNVPLLANIFIPSLKVATIMHKGRVPGVKLSKTLVETMASEAASKDQGRQARLQRAARTIAILKGLGYTGVHIGGNGLHFNDISYLLDQSERYAGQWQELMEQENFPCRNTWYMTSPAEKKDTLSLGYQGNDLVHKIIFEPDGLCFSPARQISLACRNVKWLRQLYTVSEHLSKKLLFRCRMCGDCTLAESSYICPQSGCPKKMINGPCGGSHDGYCEVYPLEKLCFWVQVYSRKKTTRPPAPDFCRHLPPKDWSLAGTSSWINYFSGIDHNKLGKKQDKK